MTTRTVFITGATGIAAETALTLARAGYKIFIASLNEQDCSELSGELHKHGAEAHFLSGDLSIPEVAEEAISRCVERFSRLDCVFNAAGISGRRYGDGPLHECTPEGLQVVLTNNLGTVVSVSRAALRVMLSHAPGRDGRRGSIVNLSSVLSRYPEPEYFAAHGYAASKGAIDSLTVSMASYYASYGIQINAVAPGLVKTPMSQRAQESNEIQDFIRTKQPLTGGMLLPVNIAGLVAFLFSDDAVALTGCVINADGGWSVS